jgi:thiamine kinase-like enzyme
MPRSRFEKVAQRWVPGDGPVDIEPLTAGLVNDSWRVARAGRLYSMRVAGSNGEDLGLDRAWECRVLARAAAAGLAPAIACCEPARGILIADWVSGRVWSEEDTRTSENIQTMAQLLRKVHALPIPRPARVMHPASWIELYAAALLRQGVPAAGRSLELRAAADARLTRLAAGRQPRAVLCHSDLHRHNLKVGSGPVLLDWEYAHAADPLWDLAGWTANNDWTDDIAADLLLRYLERTATLEESLRLRLLAWLYDYVCLQWSELYLRQRPGVASGAICARAEELAMRLTHACGSRA